MDARLEPYRVVVSFLGEALGPDYEVVLHDLTSEDGTIVAIVNNHISGRTEGAPLSNMALRFIQERMYEKQDYLAGYQGASQAKGRLRSSTMFIKDNGQLIGMLCINFDAGKYSRIAQELLALCGAHTEPSSTGIGVENFVSSLPDAVQNAIAEVTGSAGLPPDRLTMEEKIRIVESLHHAGIFYMKGAVSEVAAQLGSRARDLYTAVRQPQKPEGPAEYSRKQDPDRLVQAFQPPYLGGEQERGLRPGTENLPYAMGLAAAAARLARTMKSRDTAMRALNQRLRDGLAAFPEVVLNSPADAVPEVLNFSENCIKSETMLAFLAEAQIYVSSASACGRGQPSHTLAAMGRDPLAIDTAIRVSFCADNTPEDVDAFLNRFEDGMKHLQRIKK